MKWKIQEMLSGHPQFKFSIFAKKKWNSAERVRLLSSCSWWRVCDLISHTPTTLPANIHLFIAAKRTIWDDLGGSYTWQKQKNMLLNALAEQPEPFGGVSEKLTTYNIATKCTRALVWASIMVLSSAVIKSNPIMLGLHAIFAIYVMKISVSVCGCETLNTSGTQKQRKKASWYLFSVIMVEICLTISITADFWLHSQKHLLHVKKDVSYQIRLLANCHL